MRSSNGANGSHRLSPEHEAKLAASDEARDKNCAQIEIVTEQLREIADELSGDDAPSIVVETDENEPSLVKALAEARALAR